jgi:hypothetical protein
MIIKKPKFNKNLLKASFLTRSKSVGWDDAEKEINRYRQEIW